MDLAINIFSHLAKSMNVRLLSPMVCPPAAYDLPQRPTEAQIFYGNISRVVLSVLGSVEMSDSGESDHVEPLRPTARRGSESDRYNQRQRKCYTSILIVLNQTRVLLPCQ